MERLEHGAYCGAMKCWYGKQTVYVMIGLYATKLGQIWRLAPGADFSEIGRAHV